MKLAVISHTEHYKTPDGGIAGWGPTVMELDHLSADFQTIYHLAFLHETAAPPSALPYASEKIVFIPLPVSGGKSFAQKLQILFQMPKTLRAIKEVLEKADVFQFRAPFGIGLYLIPYLTFFSKKKGWYKYAGNWAQHNPPLGYRLQRWMLKNQSRKVTINGKWKGQPAHCLTFENPCLTEPDRREGEVELLQKPRSGNFHYCFVGALTQSKGANLVLEAIGQLSALEKFGELHVVGDGDLRSVLELKAQQLDIPVHFHGALPKNEVIEIYKNCHFIILPSQSEGFPKVIAEAMNYGCIPLVSKVSCIDQYIRGGRNGLLIWPVDVPGTLRALQNSLELPLEKQREFIVENHSAAAAFTYEHYNRRVKTEIIQKLR